MTSESRHPRISRPEQGIWVSKYVADVNDYASFNDDFDKSKKDSKDDTCIVVFSALSKMIY